MKKIISFMLIFVMIFSMAACSNKKAVNNVSSTSDSVSTDDVKATGDVASTGGNAELSLAIWDSNQEPGIRTVLDDFEAANPGIKVTVEVTPWDQYWTMLEAAATGGALPDVFWMHSNEIARYSQAGILMDLTDKIASSSVLDMSKFPEGLVNIYKWENKYQYAIPKDFDTIGLWYNKTMFDEAGLSYPDETWTWDTFKDAAKKLTNDEHYGFCAKLSQNQEGWYNFVFQNGGFIVNDDKTKSGYDDPKTMEAIDFFVDFIREGLSPDATVTTENEGAALLESGQVAMGTFGSWMLSEFANNEYTSANCDVAVLPKSNDGGQASIYNGLGWAAAAKSENPDAAWKLVEYLGTKDVQQKLSELGVAISAYEGTSEAWTKSKPQFNLNAYVEMLDYAVIRPYSVSTVAWENLATELLTPVWSLETPTEDACKDLAAKMNDLLAAE